jgi:hypothetical protein
LYQARVLRDGGKWAGVCIRKNQVCSEQRPSPARCEIDIV